MERWRRRISLKSYIFALLLLAVIVFALWFIFFRIPVCDSWECFNSNMETCKRSQFIGGSKIIFEYSIVGSEDNSCIVDVLFLQGEFNNKDSKKLEGKGMRCYLPEGIVMLPESSMGDCTGPLKEEWQEIVIEKLNSYIIQNLGKINLEVLDIPL